MATRHGRPSKAVLQQTLKRDSARIAEKFRRLPLRQPVGDLFAPYYQRILAGDLSAVSDYCESNRGSFCLDASFYELIGRLVFLQDVAAAKQIVAEITRRLVHLTGPPDDTDEKYGHWYRWLRILSESARQFIRERYKADESVKREQLWHEYIDRHYVTNFFGPSNHKKETNRSQAIKELETWGEQFCADRDWLVDLVERFWSHGLVPKAIFDELAESNRRADARAERDKRYRNRRFRWTPSSVARKYACAIAGISTGTVSHRKRMH
jgi:hypothetical protein